MSDLVTYPCATCKLNLFDRATGHWACGSETGSECGEYLEAKQWLDIIAQVVTIAKRQHIARWDQDDGLRALYSGFDAILSPLGAYLDEDQFLRLCGVRP